MPRGEHELGREQHAGAAFGAAAGDEGVVVHDEDDGVLRGVGVRTRDDR